MEKTFTSFQSRWLGLLAVLLMFVCGLDVSAQNVTIRGNNGSTVAATPQGQSEYDTFFKCGGFATWQHEQLAMVLTTSDATDLTPNGQLDNPANNLFSDGEYMQIAKGYNSYPICYVSLSLPKGYRFTGYTIQFSKPGNVTKTQDGTGGTSVTFNDSNGSSTFGETGRDFSTYTTQSTISTNGTAQTISRTEMNEGEMGNVLYFKLQNPSNSRVLINLDHAEFFFTSEENYSPVMPTGDVSNVSAVDIPFATSKVDFGPIQSRTYNGVSRVSYSSANVTDLEANFVLYEAESITDGTDVDETDGKVVAYNTGSISSEGSYFKLGRTDQEQVYFIETPTHVEISNGEEVPIGYRIVGAEFEYNNQITASRTFRISYNGRNDTYYLNTNGRFTTTQVTWEMDSDGYISSGSGTSKVYLYFNNGYASTQSEKPGESERFAIDSNNNIYQIQWPTYFITYSRSGNIRYGMISNTTGEKATYQEISTSTATLDPWTLKVYDKEGANPETITVNGSGTVKLEHLNNDAVKFGVEGIGLVRATLTLQALDPYLDHMKVVCQDQDQTEIRMTQDFTASDFSVSGGKFYFYLPADCEGHQVLITFEDLVSKYFDESYTGGSSENNSRINFVRSDHYDAFMNSDNTVNNVYNNYSEAANAQLERLKVGTVGTAKFKFNNADEVGTSGGTLEEYAFSLANYANEGGSFDQMFFTVSAADQELTRYVFTTDETRYNIAPTTAVQHRAYAFYEMEVHVQSATYSPTVEFVPVYKNALYADDKTGDFYGAVVTAVDGTGNPGYSSTNEIFRIIGEAIDAGGENVPDGADKLLYLDFSSLAGVYEITTDAHQSMDDFSATNSPNCLIFIPQGQGAPNDNVAAKSGAAGIYNVINNIKLTDKYPFYSPYELHVDAARNVSYEREVTVDKNGKVTSATVILPFIISVSDGVHTNPDGTSFTLHQIKASEALQLDVDNETYSAYAPALSDVTVTEANVPYIVSVKSPGDDDNISFVVKQTGSTIYPTTSMAGDYTFSGAPSTGVDVEEATTYTFTPKGSYAGLELAKSDGHYYYFAKNMFFCSDQLTKATLKVLPFRAYFDATNGSNVKYIGGFDIIYEDGMGDTDATAIKAVDGETITSLDGPIYNLAGQRVAVPVKGGIYIVNGKKLIVR